MSITGISRGFRRLSVLTGALGLLWALAFIAADHGHNWDGSPIVDPVKGQQELEPHLGTARIAKDKFGVPTDDEFIAANDEELRPATTPRISFEIELRSLFLS